MEKRKMYYGLDLLKFALAILRLRDEIKRREQEEENTIA